MRTERLDPLCGRPRLPRGPSRARIARGALAGLLLAGLLALSPATRADAQGTPSKIPPVPPPGPTPAQPTSERATGIRYSGHLMIGDAGQTFELTASDGKLFRLQSLRDKQGATLVFLQKAEGYLEGYSDIGDSLGAEDIRLIFICQQRPPKALQHPWKSMVIVHDRQGDVARTYGALNVVSGDTVPSLYILDKKGKLRYYAVGRLPTPSEIQAISVAVLEETSEE